MSNDFPLRRGSSASVEQYHHRLGPHSIRVLPPRFDLAHALATAAIFLDAVYQYATRLGSRDINTDHHYFTDQAVIRACFRRVRTAPARTRTARAPADTG